MKIPPHILDEIKTRLPASVVIGRHVKLQKAGREFRGLSPFQQEKTPSFFVNDQKQAWFDFSSGRNGDIFKFLMEVTGLNFVEAVEKLAHEAGVDLPKPDERTVANEQKARGIADVLELAAKFFEAEFKLTGGEVARAYAQKRSLSAETIKEFRIGYAPAGKTTLIQHLKGKGVAFDMMVEAGLARPEEDGKPARDYFVNRLIIPIQDHKGRVVAFGARALEDSQKPKYLNSPETALFHKGSTLFNVHRALKPARDGGAALVVEGYLDAIGVYQAGFLPVVASMGTAFTEAQIAMMWRLAPEPVICFDGDRAGIAAANRAVDRILPFLKPGLSFTFAFLTDGKDPDDLAREGGRDAVASAIGNGVALVDVLWRRETAEAKLDTPERRAALEAKLDEIMSTIGDYAVRKAYRTAIRSRLSSLMWEASRGSRSKTQAMDAAPLAAALANLEAGQERLVLGLAVEYPALIDKHIERLAAVPFLRANLAAFRDELLRIAADDAFDASLIGDGFAAALDEVHGAEVAHDTGKAALSRGHALRSRLPILRLSPSPDYAERVFLETLASLEIAAAERELAEATERPDIDEAETEAIMAAVREIASRKAALSGAIRALSDEAAKLRALTGAR